MKNGLTVFISGASSGFGKQAVQLLVKRGHKVIAGLRGGQARLEEVFGAELVGTGRLHAVDLHMEKPETFKAAVSEVMQKAQGKLNALINNAGYGRMGPLELITEEQLRHQMEVNFFGTVFLTQRLIPALKAGRGRVVNVSSIAGLVSFPFYGAYSASKFALEGYSEALRYELKPFGIQVGLLEPGGFRTEFSDRVAASGLSGIGESSEYAVRIKAFQHTMGIKAAKVGGDPMVVARLLVRMTERRRLPLRTLIGKDAKFMAWAQRWVPPGIRFFLVNFFFKKFYFNE